ncbi:MAG TPA: cyclase family protein [Microlunatus sp.]|nr:cyclase family protein [Microlunatus sp.]
MCTEESAQYLASTSTTHQPSGGHVSRRTALLAGAGVATSTALTVSGVVPAAADRRAERHRRGRADLTYTLGEGFPAFAPGEEAIRRPATTIPADGYYMQRWEIYEHTGTHVDAPAHFNPDGRYVNELTPEELMVPAVVIDIARRAETDPDAVVTVADLQAHERRHGRIEERAAVLMHSGWGAKVSDAAAYRGTDSAGVLHFPGFSADACEWLIRRRRVGALGVDTLSIDPGISATFDTHTILNGAERYGIENLANLHRLPASGAQITVGVVPFELGSGGPAKVLASW